MRYLIILIFIVLTSCSADEKLINERLIDIGLPLNGNFTIQENEVSGVTDYIHNIEIKVDESDHARIIKLISQRPNFFVADTVDVKTIKNKNDYPYQEGSDFHWNFFRSKQNSYEYYRIDFNDKTGILRIYYQIE